MADGLPVGRVLALRRGASGAEATTAIPLEPGELRDTLAIEGLPIGELQLGTSLRMGDTVIVEVMEGTAAAGGEGQGGLRESGSTVGKRARVVAGGVVRVGDAVLVEAVAVPFEDTLDLHAFRPDEVAAVVREYLDQARAVGLAEVRIIHGRGRGVQRETVRRLLAGSPLVAEFGDAPPERGGWGATLVRVRAVAEGRQG